MREVQQLSRLKGMGQNRLRSAGGWEKEDFGGRGLPVSLTLFLLFYCLKNSNLLTRNHHSFSFSFQDITHYSSKICFIYLS